MGNSRCPLQEECEKTCKFKRKERECDYYRSNSRPGFEIPDQEKIMQDAWDIEQTDEAPLQSVTSGEVVYLSGSNGVTEKIKRAMYDAARQFVYIGFLLWEVQENGYFNEHGYKDVYEYAETELNFKRSSTKNFIAVCKAFSNSKTEIRANGQVSILGTDISMNLQPKYEEFNYSQLCEMLAMSPAQREQVTPDMTVKELREIKKHQEPDLPPNIETIPIEMPEESDAGQTSGQVTQNEVVMILVNNIWTEVPRPLLKELVKIAGLRCTPSMNFEITIAKSTS